MLATKRFCLIITLTLSMYTFGSVNGIYDPSIAADPNYPRFFMVYQGFDNDWGDEEAIYFRIYDIVDVPVNHNRTRLDSNHDGHNCDPDIAMTTDAFVVAWVSNDADDEGIMVRVFDPNVSATTEALSVRPLTNDLSVNISTAGKQHKPAVALDDHGRFMVVWTSGTEPGREIRGRVFNTAGLPLSSELTIANTLDNFSPSVAVDPNGVFTVAWAGGNLLDYEVSMQQYYPNGTAKGNKKQLATSLYTQPNVSVDVNKSGNILVAWDGHPSSASLGDIYARLYDPNGIDLGVPSPAMVNTYGTGKQENPSASLSDSGGFVIAWQSEDSDGNDYGIRGREYDPNGIAVGEEFDINLYTYRKQYKPDVAIGSSGFPDGKEHFFTVWEYEREICGLDWDDDLYCVYFNEIDAMLDSKPGPDRVSSCGDVTNNGVVNMNDLDALAQRWLQWGYVAGLPNPDVYPDGHIDVIDLSFIAGNWLQCCQDSFPPELMEYYHQSRLIACSSKLKGIVNAIFFYAYDYEDDFPPNLEILTGEVGWWSLWPDEALMCPAVCPHTEASDYVYRGDDLDGSASSSLIIVHDKQYNHPNGKRNVAFGDGQVLSMTETEFLAAIELDNAIRRSRPQLEEKPAE